jgi:hypothetical protein
MLAAVVVSLVGQARAQDRIIVQQGPAEIRRGSDANVRSAGAPSNADSKMAVGETTPTLSLLLSDGSWKVGRLASVGTEGWRLAVRGGAGFESVLVAPTDVIAFIVRRSSLLPALGSDAELRRCTEGSLLQVTPLSLGVIETVDGQRLPGTFRFANGRALWDHRWIGTVPVDLERISTLRMIADRSAPVSTDSDSVLLVNGDIVHGFVDGIGESVELSPLEPVGRDETGSSVGTDDSGSENPAPSEPEDGSKEADPSDQARNPSDKSASQSPSESGPKSGPKSRPAAASQATSEPKDRRIPMERVAALALAEMPPVPRDGIDIWTADGSIVGAKSLSFTDPVGWSFTLDADWLRAIRSQPTADNQAADPLGGVLDRRRFLALADCPSRIVRDADSDTYRYRSDRPARLRKADRYLLGCTEIEIDGPSTIAFEMPERFGEVGTIATGMVALKEPCSTDTRVEIVLSFCGSSGDRIVLDGSRRCQSFTLRSAGKPAGGLTISVRDAGNGVMGDRIVLERAALIAPD